MTVKEKKVMLSKRFLPSVVANWQEQADLETRGNLSLWIELTLNKSLKNKKK